MNISFIKRNLDTFLPLRVRMRFHRFSVIIVSPFDLIVDIVAEEAQRATATSTYLQCSHVTIITFKSLHDAVELDLLVGVVFHDLIEMTVLN